LLFNHIFEAHDIIQLKSGGNTMPLLALYKKSCMHQGLELLKNGERRLRESVETFKTKAITLNETLERYALNINTPEEFKKIQ